MLKISFIEITTQGNFFTLYELVEPEFQVPFVERTDLKIGIAGWRVFSKKKKSAWWDWRTLLCSFLSSSLLPFTFA